MFFKLNMKKLKSLKLKIFIFVLLIISMLFSINAEQNEPSASQDNDTRMKTIISVLPQKITNDLEKEKIIVNLNDNGTSSVCTVYPAKDNNNIIGYAVTSVKKGYSGKIEVVVGVLPDNSIRAIKVLKQNETPGLGSKVNTPEFLNQFSGKTLDSYNFKVKKDGGDVDAITAATVSSRAASEAIELALKAVKKIQKF